jgi:hypothetical protein
MLIRTEADVLISSAGVEARNGRRRARRIQSGFAETW